MTKKPLLILAAVAVFIAGCTMAPKFERPASPVPDAWPTGAAYPEAKPASSIPTPSETAWREVFPDEKLQKVIELALNNSRDLRLVVLNVEKARALYGIQRAQLFPAVNAVGSGSRTRVPADLSTTGQAGASSQYSVTGGISSWEIDFFGRIQSLKDAALEEYLATDQERRSAQILLISAVANTYLTLAADRENLKLSQSTLEAQEASYRLIKKRYDVGLSNELDLRRSQSQVEAARVDAARNTQLVARDENALNLLVGKPVPTELLPAQLAGIAPPKEITPGLPSEQLLQRPDVLAAEHRLRESNANIGAARAAFFPRISLTTYIGTASNDLSNLFRAGQDTWSFAPQIVLPIFDARLWSAYDLSKVQKEQAVTQYEKTIQTAFREVADALAVQGTVDKQIAAQRSLVEAVSETYRLSNARYVRGIDSYLSVLDAQRNMYGAQQGLITLQLVRINNLVTLFKVLGGGV
jgi:multidrug efflux system outer membrane protein